MIKIVRGAYGYAGQVVIVTGGASGIGLGIVELLAEAGAKVVIADIDVARAREQAERLATSDTPSTRSGWTLKTRFRS